MAHYFTFFLHVVRTMPCELFLLIDITFTLMCELYEDYLKYLLCGKLMNWSSHKKYY